MPPVTGEPQLGGKEAEDVLNDEKGRLLDEICEDDKMDTSSSQFPSASTSMSTEIFAKDSEQLGSYASRNWKRNLGRKRTYRHFLDGIQSVDAESGKSEHTFQQQRARLVHGIWASIKNVHKISSSLLVNKSQCKHIADHFKVVGDVLKKLGLGEDFVPGKVLEGGSGSQINFDFDETRFNHIAETFEKQFDEGDSLRPAGIEYSSRKFQEYVRELPAMDRSTKESLSLLSKMDPGFKKLGVGEDFVPGKVLEGGSGSQINFDFDETCFNHIAETFEKQFDEGDSLRPAGIEYSSRKFQEYVRELPAMDRSTKESLSLLSKMDPGFEDYRAQMGTKMYIEPRSGYRVQHYLDEFLYFLFGVLKDGEDLVMFHKGLKGPNDRVVKWTGMSGEMFVQIHELLYKLLDCYACLEHCEGTEFASGYLSGSDVCKVESILYSLNSNILPEIALLDNFLSIEMATAIAKLLKEPNSALKELSIESSPGVKVDQEELRKYRLMIIAALSKSVGLARLTVRALNGEEVHELCKSLRANKVLKNLVISIDGPLGDMDALYLSTTLKENRSLKYFELEFDDVSDDGVGYLGAILSDSSLSGIFRWRQSRRFMKFDFSKHASKELSIESSPGVSVNQEGLRKYHLMIIAALSKSVGLARLTISIDGPLADMDALYLSTTLKENRSLKYFELEFDDVSDDGFGYLGAILSDSSLSGIFRWRQSRRFMKFDFSNHASKELSIESSPGVSVNQEGLRQYRLMIIAALSRSVDLARLTVRALNGEEVYELCKSLRADKGLRNLVISIDGPLGDMDAKYLSTMLKEIRNLAIFELEFDDVSDDGVGYLGAILTESSLYGIFRWRQSRRFMKFDFSNHASKELSIESSPGVSVNQEGFRQYRLMIIAALSRSVDLARLTVRALNGEEVHELCKSLRANKVLKNLVISIDGPLGDMHAFYLSTTLKENRSLKYFELEFDDVSDDGFGYLGAISSDSSLSGIFRWRQSRRFMKFDFSKHASKELSIESSPGVSVNQEGFRQYRLMIIAALSRSVDLARLTVRALNGEEVYELCKSLRADKGLRNLVISIDGPLGDMDAKYLSTTLKENRRLEYFELEFDDVSDDGFGYLRAILSDGFLSGIFRWRQSRRFMKFVLLKHALNEMSIESSPGFSVNQEGLRQYRLMIIAALSRRFGLDRLTVRALNGEEVHELCNSLRANDVLKNLVISIDGPLGDMDAIYLSTMLKENRRLEYFEMEFDDVSDDGVGYLGAISSDSSLSGIFRWRQSRRFMKFDFSKHALSEMSIESSPGVSINQEGLRKYHLMIIAALSKSVGLARLTISIDGPLADMDALYLSTTLKENRSLKYFELEFDDVSDDGFGYLGAILSDSSLSGIFRWRQSRRFMKFDFSNHASKELSIESSPGVSVNQEGLRQYRLMIIAALSRSVDLARLTVRALNGEEVYELCKSLRADKGLRNLVISIDGPLGDMDAKYLSTMLKEIRNLAIFELEFDDVSDDGVGYLGAILTESSLYGISLRSRKSRRFVKNLLGLLMAYIDKEEFICSSLNEGQSSFEICRRVYRVPLPLMDEFNSTHALRVIKKNNHFAVEFSFLDQDIKCALLDSLKKNTIQVLGLQSRPWYGRDNGECREVGDCLEALLAENTTLEELKIHLSAWDRVFVNHLLRPLMAVKDEEPHVHISIRQLHIIFLDGRVNSSTEVSHNEFAEVVESIARMLRTNKTLSHFSLNYVFLKTSEVCEIVDSLKTNKALQELCLDCEVRNDPQVKEALIDLLVNYNFTLNTISLRGIGMAMDIKTFMMKELMVDTTMTSGGLRSLLRTTSNSPIAENAQDLQQALEDLKLEKGEGSRGEVHGSSVTPCEEHQEELVGGFPSKLEVVCRFKSKLEMEFDQSPQEKDLVVKRVKSLQEDFGSQIFRFIDSVDFRAPLDVQHMYSQRETIGICQTFSTNTGIGEELQAKDSIQYGIVQDHLTGAYYFESDKASNLVKPNLDKSTGVIGVKVTSTEVHVEIMWEDGSYYFGALEDFSYDLKLDVNKQCALEAFGDLKGAHFLKTRGLKCSPLLVIALAMAIRKRGLALMWSNGKGHIEINSILPFVQPMEVEVWECQILFGGDINQLGETVEWGMNQFDSNHASSSGVHRDNQCQVLLEHYVDRNIQVSNSSNDTSRDICPSNKVNDASSYTRRCADLSAALNAGAQNKQKWSIAVKVLGSGGDIGFDKQNSKGKKVEDQAFEMMQELYWEEKGGYIIGKLDDRHELLEEKLYQGSLYAERDLNYLVVYDGRTASHVSIYWVKEQVDEPRLELEWITDIFIKEGPEKIKSIFKGLKGETLEVTRTGTQFLENPSQQQSKGFMKWFRNHCSNKGSCQGNALQMVSKFEDHVHPILEDRSNDEWEHIVGLQPNICSNKCWWKASYMQAITYSRTRYSSGLLLSTHTSEEYGLKWGSCKRKSRLHGLDYVHRSSAIKSCGKFSKPPQSLSPKWHDMIHWGGLKETLV